MQKKAFWCQFYDNNNGGVLTTIDTPPLLII